MLTKVRFCFCFAFLFCCNLMASSAESMPWDSPLEKLSASLTGPVAKVGAIVSIAGAGLALAVNQSEGFSRTAIRLVFGLSIAFGAATLVSTLFGNASGMLI